MDHALFGEIVGQAPLGIVVLDRDLSVQYINQAARTLHGIVQDVLIEDITFADLVTDPASLLEALDLVCSESVTSLVVPYEIEMPEGSRFILSTVGRIRCDSCTDQQDAILVIADDVTARKELNAEIVETEKTALIGQMLLTLQHEINNPLQVIFGQVDVAIASAATDQSVKRSLEEIQRAAQRIAALLRHLASLDRVETVQYINHMRMINVDIDRAQTVDPGE